MATRTLSGTTTIARSPEQVWDLVSDVTRTGEWSPTCTSCWWDQGAGPVVGNWFTGRNEIPGRTWETRSLVVASERGRVFAWNVGESLSSWGYSMVPVDGGTEVTEFWEFLPDGLAYFRKTYGADADAQIANRTEMARTGIPETLAALKRIAEAS